jgi:hypothetical protein
MPRFNSLSDVIHQQIQQEVLLPQAPAGTPIAVATGIRINTSSVNVVPRGGFIWGRSTWGVDNISNRHSPDVGI